MQQHRVERQRTNLGRSSGIFDFALAVAVAVSLAVVAQGNTDPWGRRSLSQQSAVTPKEVLLTQENITNIQQVVGGLVDGSVLILAVNEVQIDEPLRLESSLTIRGEPTDARPVVKCTQKKGAAFHVKANHVVLEHLVIVGCGSPAVQLERPEDGDDERWESTIRDVNFEGNGDPQNSRTALPSRGFLTGGGIGCGGGFDLTVEDSTFELNTAIVGAGINVDGSSLTVVNSTFVENVAEGALFSRGGAINIMDSSQSAGDIILEVRSSIFIKNKDSSGASKANTLILSNGAPLERSQFISFPTPSLSGGGIFASKIAAVEIVDSLFVNNSAVPAGGAIFLSAVSRAEITNCQFSGNSVAAPERSTGLQNRLQGGALYAELLQADDRLTVKGSVFENNSADCGGAIHIVGAVVAKVQIEECKFDSNSATLGGGAFLLRNIHTAVLSRIAFVSNSAVLGGGMLLTNEAGLSATSFVGDSATKFEGNLAVNGGGIAMFGAGVVNLESIPFISNHALYHGGGLAIMDGSVSTSVVIERANMEKNTASRGGAIFMDSVSKVHITPNSPEAVNVFKRNVANRGGAIYFESQSNMQSRLKVRKMEFVENLAVVAFDDASKKIASSGGFFEDPQVAKATELNALEMVIEDRIERMDVLKKSFTIEASSTATEDSDIMEGSGGGVFLALSDIPKRGSVSVELQEASFIGNIATKGGGLMTVMDDGEWVSHCEAHDALSSPMNGVCRAVSLTDIEFIDNGAQETGGAISATHPENIYVFDDIQSEEPVILSDSGFADDFFVNNMVDVGGDGDNVGTVLF